MVCYNPLWKTLIDKGINKTKLKEMLGCSSATISSMTNNKYVSLEIIDKICEKLHCEISDIIEYKKEM